MAENNDKTRITGVVNSHEKSAPEFRHYPNGNSRLTFNLIYKEGGDTKFMDMVAYDKEAERLYSLIKGADLREFTVTGEIKEKGEYKHLKIENHIAHQIMSITGEIKHVSDKKIGNKDYKDVFVTYENEHGIKDSVNAHIPVQKELNGVTLEKGQAIAVNGLSNEFVHQDGKRSVSLETWNVAPTQERLQELIEERKHASQQKRAQETEMSR